MMKKKNSISDRISRQRTDQNYRCPEILVQSLWKLDFPWIGWPIKWFLHNFLFPLHASG